MGIATSQCCEAPKDEREQTKFLSEVKPIIDERVPAASSSASCPSSSRWCSSDERKESDPDEEALAEAEVKTEDDTARQLEFSIGTCSSSEAVAHPMNEKRSLRASVAQPPNLTYEQLEKRQSIYDDFRDEPNAYSPNEYIEYLDMLHMFSALSEVEKAAVAEAFQHVRMVRDDTIFEEGETPNAFYILLQGSVCCLLNGEAFKSYEADSKSKQIHYFGDRAIIEGDIRRHTAKVSSESAELLMLDTEDFNDLLGSLKDVFNSSRPSMRSTIKTTANFMKYLNGLKILDTLTTHQKEEVADALEVANFHQGDFLWQCDDPATSFYIIIDGSVEVFFEGRLLRVLNASLEAEALQYVGDRGLLLGEPRVSTVKVSSLACKTVKLNREDFIRYLANTKELKTVTASKESAYMQHFSGTIPNGDLNIVKVLNKTGYGSFSQAKHRLTGEMYGITEFTKSVIQQKELQTNAIKLRLIWSKANSPFVVKLFTTYNKPKSIVLVHDFCDCSLRGIYQREKLHGNEDCMRFYAASLALALQHLQNGRFIHRDVRPENVLVNFRGHAKLGGFALSTRVVEGKTFTTCGSPNYMAPEILLGTGHNKGVDWWALGVVAYELMAGKAPFDAPSQPEVMGNVMKGIKKVQLPDVIKNNSHVYAFVTALCEQEPSKRLGMRVSQKISTHEVFKPHDKKKFSWKLMKTLGIEPPYVPKKVSTTDLATQVSSLGTVPSGNSDESVKYPEWEKDFGPLMTEARSESKTSDFHRQSTPASSEGSPRLTRGLSP